MTDEGDPPREARRGEEGAVSGAQPSASRTTELRRNSVVLQRDHWARRNKN